MREGPQLDFQSYFQFLPIFPSWENGTWENSAWETAHASTYVLAEEPR